MVRTPDLDQGRLVPDVTGYLAAVRSRGLD